MMPKPTMDSAQATRPMGWTDVYVDPPDNFSVSMRLKRSTDQPR